MTIYFAGNRDYITVDFDLVFYDVITKCLKSNITVTYNGRKVEDILPF